MDNILINFDSIEDYNKMVSEKTKEALIEKYGVDNASKIPGVQEKKNKTMIKNYGSLENAYNERNKNMSKTLLEKTGYDHNMKDPRTREKARETFKEKYGVDSPF